MALLRSLLSAAGVDFDQWFALTRAMLRRDFRTRSSSLRRSGGTPVTGGRALIFQAIFYSIIGTFIWGALAFAKDLYFVGMLVCVYVMFMTGTAVLLDHSSALTASDDYAVLGFRPISSRTYFAVRLTNVLAYILLLTTMVTYIPIASLFVMHGPIVGVAGIAALYGSSLFIAFTLLVTYGALQRFVGAERLKQALSVVQLLMSFSVYGGYFLVQRAASQSFLSGFTFEKTWLVAAAPPAWFASYLAIAVHDRSLITLVPAAVSLLALGLLIRALTGSLASGFAERLGEASLGQRASRASVQKSSRAGWLFSAGEARAMALLIRSQFRNDQKFRMGVLAIVPLTVLYIFQGLSHSGRSATPGSEFTLVRFAIMMFPAMLKSQLSQSDSFRASWIFFAAPASRARLIRAATNVVVAMFLVPYLVFVGAAMAYASADKIQALVHVLMLGLLSHLVLQFTVLIDPELPFSRPAQKGKNVPTLMLMMFGIMLVSVAIQVATPWLYESLAHEGMAMVGVIAVSGFVELLTRARIDEQTRALEFAG